MTSGADAMHDVRSGLSVMYQPGHGPPSPSRGTLIDAFVGSSRWRSNAKSRGPRRGDTLIRIVEMPDTGPRQRQSIGKRFARSVKTTLKPRLIFPDGAFYKNWSLLMVTPLLYTAIVTPFYVGLMVTTPTPVFVIDRTVDALFIIDMILNFFLVYRSEQTGVMVYDHRKIVSHYLRGGFPVDLLSSVPLDLLTSSLHVFSDSGSVLRALRIIRLVRLAKLLRIFRVSKFMQAIEDSMTIDYGYLQMGQHIAVLLLSTHWIACLFLLFTGLEALWMEDIETALPQWDGAMEGRSHFGQYIAALYWAGMTLTTIGYGDIHPYSEAQQLFVTMVMLAGALMYGYIIGAVSALLCSASERRHLFYNIMTRLNQFMSDQVLPVDLKTKLRRYFRYKCNYAMSVGGTRALLDMMSPALQQEVAVYTCQSLMAEVPYFKGCDLAFLMECALNIEDVVFAPMELAVKEGRNLAHITIIRKGVMVALGRILTKGKVLGQECLYKECPASYSVRSMTFTDCSLLARSSMLSCLRRFPKLLRHFCLLSIQGIFREEVLAYAEAMQRIQTEKQLIEAGYFTSRHGGEEHYDVPELNPLQPSLRVVYYMQKLRMYLVVDKEEAARLSTAATVIQRSWRAHLQAKKVRRMRETMMRIRRVQKIMMGNSFGAAVFEGSQALGLAESRRVPARQSTAQRRLDASATMHHRSVLDVAKYTPGTGVGASKAKRKRSRAASSAPVPSASVAGRGVSRRHAGTPLATVSDDVCAVESSARGPVPGVTLRLLDPAPEADPEPAMDLKASRRMTHEERTGLHDDVNIDDIADFGRRLAHSVSAHGRASHQSARASRRASRYEPGTPLEASIECLHQTLEMVAADVAALKGQMMLQAYQTALHAVGDF